MSVGPSPNKYREWQGQFEGLPRIDSYQLVAEEIAGCGDLAYVRLSYPGVFPPAEASDPISMFGSAYHILRKELDGRWLVAREIIVSHDPPLAESS
jgi:ketosteroid isomerase-like protein